MIWNHLIHIIAGLIGASIFLFNVEGILTAVLITAITQTVDIIRMYRYHRNLILQKPDEIKEEQLRIFNKGAFLKFSQLFLLKVVWYSIIILFAAYITRSLTA